MPLELSILNDAASKQGHTVMVPSSMYDESNHIDISSKIPGYSTTIRTGATSVTSVTANTTSATSQNYEGAFAFNADGTKGFLGGEDETLYEYSLSTAFDISTISYTGNSLSFAAYATYITDINYVPSINKLFLSDSVDGKIISVDVNPEFDTSSLVYVTTVSSLGKISMSRFNSDGTKLFTMHRDDKELKVTTLVAYDLTTISTTVTRDLSAFSHSFITPIGLEFNSDGSSMFLLDYNGSSIYEYLLDTAYGVEECDGVHSQVKAVSNQYGFKFVNGGTQLLLVDSGAPTELVMYDVNGTVNTSSVQRISNEGTTSTRKLHDVFGDNSCIATYNMDGNVEDLGGNYDAVTSNTSFMKGPIYGSRALVYNGMNSETTLPFSSSSTFSISAYVAPTYTSENKNIISIDTQSSNNPSCLLKLAVDNTIGVTVNDGAGGYLFVTPPSGILHCVTVIDGLSNKLYINGDKVIDYTATEEHQVGPLMIGCRPQSAGDDNFFNGWISQVRVFNKALIQNEVTALYTETTPRLASVDTADVFGDGSILAHYKLDGDATDNAGSYDGVPVDITYVDGKFTQAGLFNNTSSRLAIDNTIAGVTVSMFINFSAPAPGNNRLFNIYDGATTFADVIFSTIGCTGNQRELHWNVLHDGKVYINTLQVLTSVILEPDIWHHVVFNLLPGDWSSCDVLIGDHRNNGDYSADCAIDQVRIFNKELSPLEVLKLYDEKQPYKAVISK